MAKISYVYPNVSELNKEGRNKLSERWKLAKNLGCDYIEVPAHFIQSGWEIDHTKLKRGDFLTGEAIKKIYKKDDKLPHELKYILHTEYRKPRLKWYDKKWVNKFVNMIISISDSFKIPADIIEIHPGNKPRDKRNYFSDIQYFKEIINAITYLLDRYTEKFGVEPFILIENRTDQRISCGKDIEEFWDFLSGEYPHLKKKTGIVLDVQQLYTATKKNFLKEFKMIHLESAIKGFHIHNGPTAHQVPTLSDKIPWEKVFDRIADMGGDIIINPEVHHKNKVEDAIKFCKGMLDG